MRRILALVLAFLLLPMVASANSGLDELMKKFGHGWEYGECAISTSPFKLVLPDDMWPVEPSGSMLLAACTETFERTGGKSLECVWGTSDPAAKQIEEQMEMMLAGNKQMGIPTFVSGRDENAYQLWQEKLRKQELSSYFETTQITYGGQVFHVFMIMENYNRRDAINTLTLISFDYNNGESVCTSVYTLIESADPTRPAEVYSAHIDQIRQQLLDFVGTVVVEK